METLLSKKKNSEKVPATRRITVDIVINDRFINGSILKKPMFDTEKYYYYFTEVWKDKYTSWRFK